MLPAPTGWPVNRTESQAMHLEITPSGALHCVRSGSAAQLARGFAPRDEAARDTRTRPLPHDPASTVPRLVPSAPRSRGSLLIQLLISGGTGTPPSRTVSTPAATPEMRGLPLCFLLYFLPFPLAPSMRPHPLPPCPPPPRTRKSGCPNSQSHAPQAEGRASGPPFPPPGLVSYLPSSPDWRGRAIAQAHPVASRKATAFPSPRRPGEPWPISEHQLKGGAPRRRAGDVDGVT